MNPIESIWLMKKKYVYWVVKGKSKINQTCAQTHIESWFKLMNLISTDYMHCTWMECYVMKTRERNDDWIAAWAFPASIRVVSKIDYRTLIISFNYRYYFDSFFLSFLPARLLSDSVNLIRSVLLLRVELRWVEIWKQKMIREGWTFFYYFKINFSIPCQFTKHPREMFVDKNLKWLPRKMFTLSIPIRFALDSLIFRGT